MKLVQASEHFPEKEIKNSIKSSNSIKLLSEAQANFANFEVKITCFEFTSDH